MAKRNQEIDSDEIARRAGFSSLKSLKEPTSKVLDRAVAAGKVKVMRIGNRKYYETETAKRHLAEVRKEPPKGWVQAGKLAQSLGYSRDAGTRACRNGHVATIRVIPKSGTKAAWYADPAQLRAYLGREHKRTLLSAAPAPTKVRAKAATRSPESIRLAKVIERLEGLADSLEAVLGSTRRQLPAPKDEIVLNGIHQ